MHNFEHEVDASILAAMMDWAKPIPNFRVEHASLALFCSTGYIQYCCEGSAEQRMLFALNSAYWWWLDDIIDENIQDPSPRVPWNVLLQATRDGLPPGDAPPEIEYLRRLSEAFKRLAPSPAEHRWWLSASLGTLEGFRESDEASRAQRIITYAEHLESAFWSTSMVQVIAAASLLFGLGLGDRSPHEPTLIERMIAIIARLENDVASVDRGRREGCTSNAVVIVEQVLPTDAAKRFVSSQVDGYVRRLMRALEPLGSSHKISLLCKGILAAHRRYYGDQPGRYAG